MSRGAKVVHSGEKVRYFVQVDGQYRILPLKTLRIKLSTIPSHQSCFVTTVYLHLLMFDKKSITTIINTFFELQTLVERN